MLNRKIIQAYHYVPPTCDSLELCISVSDQLLAEEPGGMGPQAVSHHVEVMDA